jgi:hypothetical protein
VLIERSSTSRPASHDGTSRQPIRRFEVAADVAGIEWTVEPEGPRERATPLGQLETAQLGVQMGTSTKTLTSRIGNDATFSAFDDHHETDQIGLGSHHLAPNTRTDGRGCDDHR